MTTSEPNLLEALDEGVLTLTLNRHDCLNAFNDDLSFALQKALQRAEKDQAVRCIILTGAGRAFSAGQDLQSRSISAQNGGKPHLGDSLRNRYKPIIEKLRTLEKPVIGMINGVAAGAGASIAFACDFRIASEQATFLQAFIKVGLVPDSGACWLLPRLSGLGTALELMMTGRKVDAQEALRIGLVNRVTPPEQLREETMQLAKQFAQGPTRAYGLMKRAVNHAMTMDLESYLAYEADLQEIAGQTDDYLEGVTAFLEKRPANFSGR